MKTLIRFSLVLFVCMVFMPTNRSAAYLLENCTEAKLRDLGVAIVNCSGASTCEIPKANSAADPLASGSSVYILGDSITYLSTDKIESLFSQEPVTYEISKINADSGRAITYDSAGEDPTGLEAVVADSTIIAGSQAVVVALGTNSGNEDLSVEIPNLLTKIRDTGFSGQIYWVNLFYTTNVDGARVRNATIDGQSNGQIKYVVIDAANAGIELGSDLLHPSEAGESMFADTIFNGLKNLPASGGLVRPEITGQCACFVDNEFGTMDTSITWGEGVWGSGSEIYQSGLTGPYTIEQWAIHVLKNIARKAGKPEGDLVTQYRVIALVSWAKLEGGGFDGHVGSFNPLNTKLGHEDLGGVNQDSDGNPSTDNNSKGYPDFDRGVEAITRTLFKNNQKRIGTALINPDFSADSLDEAIAGDFYSPDGVTVINNLEDLYPGDQVYAAASITGYYHGADFNDGYGDRTKFLIAKRSTLERMWTPEGYVAFAGKILDGFGQQEPAEDLAPASDLLFTPTTSGIPAGTDSGGCQQENGGVVDVSGYSFPLAPQTRAVGGIGVGWSGLRKPNGDPIHHDGTAAFDLFSTDSADVYAITSGKVYYINTNFNEEMGCTAIDLLGDDGFHYAFLHMKNPTVAKGYQVRSGEKLGQIADGENYTGKCWGGGPHLHIDRGCVIDGVPQKAGHDECRDLNFIEFLSKLYESLPEG